MNICKHMIIRIRNLVLEEISWIPINTNSRRCFLGQRTTTMDLGLMKSMLCLSNVPFANTLGLKEHGKDWPKLKEMIPTRTRTQIKSH